ncbi:hypothetical protein HXW94_17965, partial [Desulfobacter latus]|nr:hypothetical protein [Desulfobacter latus]
MYFRAFRGSCKKQPLRCLLTTENTEGTKSYSTRRSISCFLWQKLRSKTPMDNRRALQTFGFDYNASIKQNQDMNPHDHNFKNLFLDFPKEALAWLFPEAEQNWGQVINVEFVRQEPKKHSLSDKS